MEQKKRKPMRLKGFDYSQNGVYFVTICTKEKAKVLGEIVGGGAFDTPQCRLTEIGKTVEKFILSTNKIPTVSVDKYVIMPNHIHMILIVDNQDGTSRAPSPTNMLIPHTVSTLKRFVNKALGTDIFQRSFYDRVVRGYDDYLRIWEYIEHNPARWKEDKYYTEEKP